MTWLETKKSKDETRLVYNKFETIVMYSRNDHTAPFIAFKKAVAFTARHKILN